MNVASIIECVKPLNAWIHEGDDTVRGQREECLRTLGEKSVTPEEATKCLSLVMGAFVKYSEGTGKRTVFPYEGSTGSSTTAFLNVPTGTLACTLSRMYPFAVNPKDTWDRLRTIKMYPLPCVWPRTVVKRFTKFNEMVYNRYEELKKAYEKSGGTYHGDSDEEKEQEEDPADLEEKKGDIELECDKFF